MRCVPLCHNLSPSFCVSLLAVTSCLEVLWANTVSLFFSPVAEFPHGRPKLLIPLHPDRVHATFFFGPAPPPLLPPPFAEYTFFFFWFLQNCNSHFFFSFIVVLFVLIEMIAPSKPSGRSQTPCFPAVLFQSIRLLLPPSVFGIALDGRVLFVSRFFVSAAVCSVSVRPFFSSTHNLRSQPEHS